MDYINDDNDKHLPLLVYKTDRTIVTQNSIDSVTDHKVECICSQRWILAYSTFFCNVLADYFMNSFSVALVCMVKDDISNQTLFNESALDNRTHPTDTDDLHEKVVNNQNAEFEWNKTIRSAMLTSFFYGYIVTQIPGGWLAFRFGGKKVLGLTMFTASMSTLLLPICARQSYIFVFVLRLTLGLALGIVLPCISSMWGRWAPPFERSKLTQVPGIGQTVGSVGAFATSGLLCEHGFDNGWGSIFYITGGLAVLWVLAWIYLTSDTPTTHPRITEKEKKYLACSIEYNTNHKSFSVPWRHIFTSRAVWACLTGHVCYNWISYTLTTSLPAFMKEVLKFDIEENGLLISVPYIFQAVAAFFASFSADFLRSRHILNTTWTRKLYQVVGLMLYSLCIAASGFIPLEHRYVAVALLSLGLMFSGVCQAGVFSNHVDFAPKYAGVTFGITNAAATVPGMVAPIVAGALTPHGTQEEWRNVFCICAGVGVFGSLIFGTFGSGEMESWAADPVVELDITCIENDIRKLETNSFSELNSECNEIRENQTHQNTRL